MLSLLIRPECLKLYVCKVGLRTLCVDHRGSLSFPVPKNISNPCPYTLSLTLYTEINQLTSIACLVNNVGIFMSLDFIRNLIACNMNSTASLTRIVLPKLIKQNKPGSAIINLSSFAGTVPFPYLALYGATKSFVHNLTESLRLELAGTGVIVQTVCPMLVATNMSKVKRTGFFVPPAEKFASSALDMLGVEHVTMGCLGHAIQSWILASIPGMVARTGKSKYELTMRRLKRQ
ncbi:unnamed protein product [Echinostoma caproni]|uniref:Very-long-chain 3-oxoacyl-CoA reductase n=1 Tax=Echinostoma caproni TaxID=27848 RepID=A0A183AFN1_9TREM|nr:unnamed protein product [Echinostoma caproni]